MECNPIRAVLFGHRHAQREDDVRGTVRTACETTGSCCHWPRNIWGHQKLEEARTDPSLQVSGGECPCWHFDGRLLASSTARQHVSVVLSHPACSILLWQSQESSSVDSSYAPALATSSSQQFPGFITSPSLPFELLSGTALPLCTYFPLFVDKCT